MPLEIQAGTVITTFKGNDADLKRAYREGEQGAQDFASRVGDILGRMSGEEAGRKIGKGISTGLSLALGDIGNFVNTAENLVVS